MIKAAGVEIKLNTSVGKDIAFEKIRKDYDAIFMATGARSRAGLSAFPARIWTVFTTPLRSSRT